MVSYEVHGQSTLQTGHVDAVAAALLDLKRGTSMSSQPQQLSTSSTSVASLQSHDVSRPSSQTNVRICKDDVVKTATATSSAPPPLQMPQSTLSVSAPQPLNRGLTKQPATVLAEASSSFEETNSSSRQQLIMASLQEYQRRAQLPINYFDSNKIVELSGGAMHHHSSYPHPPSQSATVGLLLPPPPSLLPTQSYGEQSFDRCRSNSLTMVSDASATAGTTTGSQSFDTLMSHDASNNNIDYYNHDDDDIGGNNENSNLVLGPLSQTYGGRVESRGNNGGGGGGPLSEIYEESRFSKQKVTSTNTTTTTTAAHHYGNANPPIKNTKHRTAPGRLPNHVRDYLKHWVDNHIDYPYPSEKEKEIMMHDTGIERKKLDIWFRNNRNRYVKAKRSAKQLQQMQQHMHKMKYWNHDPQLILKP